MNEKNRPQFTEGEIKTIQVTYYVWLPLWDKC